MKVALMESDIKDYLKELFDEAANKVFWEQAKEEEPWSQPKSYFDVMMEAANNYNEKKFKKVIG